MKLKIGILGTGHLGKIHIKCILLASDHFELTGFYDPSETARQLVVDTHGIQAFTSAEALIQECDIIDIVSPTTTHFEMAKMVIEAGKHVFIEKPLTHTVEEAKTLIALSEKHGVKVQVGHVERFNPALLSLDNMTLNPMFIEAHRLATFNPRGTDVSVVLDLMIHDLDILLSMVDSDIKSVAANGVCIVSPTPDIANARIEFKNGCVANLTASRISLKQMRKLRLFQSDAYISLDFLDKQAQVVRLYDEGDANIPNIDSAMTLDTALGKKIIDISMPVIGQVNAIKMELETFAESIVQDETPKVSIKDGYRALELAYWIMEEID